MSLLVGHTRSEVWRARYAWSAERGGTGLEIRRFRNTLQLYQEPPSFVVYVSADSRYRLWVNGTPVGRGPLKGTLNCYYYEAYDLAPYLEVGENVVAVEVRWFGEHAPRSEVHGDRPGFLFEGPLVCELDTPGTWRVQVDRSTRADADRLLGYWERVDAGRVPHGWRDVGFDDAAWEQAVDAGSAMAADLWPENASLRQTLCVRELPMLIEDPRRFAATWRAGSDFPHLFEARPLGWRLRAGEGGELILDAGALTTGYPALAFEGGAGRTVQVIYDQRAPPAAREEEHAPVAGRATGHCDTVRLSGGAWTWEPFHWRAFWSIKLVVSPGETPFTLSDAGYRFTTYPQALGVGFDADLDGAKRMMAVSWRTAQLCTHETYESDPYDEQLNCLADSRIQALCSMALAGETALPRHTIRLFRDSVRPDGLVCGQVPSTMPLCVPYAALIWVLMVEDYWQYVGPPDRDFVRSNLHTVDGVLWFYRERLREDGFVGPIPPQNVVDHVPAWRNGIPPSILDGESTYLTCLYICALDAAVRLHRDVGEPLDADRWLHLADRLRRSVQEGAWSEREGLFLEGPGRTFDGLSQHSQAMAILAGAATGRQMDRILERLTSDPTLHRMTFMQSYYLARALQEAGGYAAFGGHVLSLWRTALDRGLTTWPSELDSTRGDCRASGSWVAVDFVTCGLGIRPYAPGYQEILIAPCTEMCSYVRGWAPTPQGRVRVDWRKDRNSGAVYLYVSAPEEMPVRVKLPGIRPRRYRKGGRIAVVAGRDGSKADAGRGIELGTGAFLADLQQGI